MIADAITAAMNTIMVMERKTVADKAEKAALAARVARGNKATENKLQNLGELTIMQQNLKKAMRCKKSDQEFEENGFGPMLLVDTPPAHTRAFHQVQETTVAMRDKIWPRVGVTKSAGNYQVTQVKLEINPSIGKTPASQSYAEAL